VGIKGPGPASEFLGIDTHLEVTDPNLYRLTDCWVQRGKSDQIARKAVFSWTIPWSLTVYHTDTRLSSVQRTISMWHRALVMHGRLVWALNHVRRTNGSVQRLSSIEIIVHNATECNKLLTARWRIGGGQQVARWTKVSWPSPPSAAVRRPCRADSAAGRGTCADARRKYLL